ncbi:hypothetical protein MHYP_G00312840 [Metynnis hypsauchen]
MSGQPPQQRRPNNVGSSLLSSQENDMLYSHLGKKCSSLSSAVVQVYSADRNASWTKRCCGVACLVKDNPQRSYFIRVYDIRAGRSLFEQEIYADFSVKFPRSYFMTFAGDTCQIGLNFSSEEEAKRFKVASDGLLEKRQRKTEKRRDPPNGPTLPMATVDIKNPEINNIRYNNNVQVNSNLHSNFRKDKSKGKNKKKKISKAEIGTPSNFRHIGHVGWDPNTGFDVNNLDPELKKLFDMCGISEAQLKDKETSKVIYEFIEKKGGVEAVKDELRRQAPPPPPSRGGPPPPPPHSSGPPPPPPPARGRGVPPPPPPARAPFSAPPPPPPSRPGMGVPPPPPPSRGYQPAPPPPPPPASASMAPQAPPPPPPPTSAGGAPPPPPPPPPPGPPPPAPPPVPGDSGDGPPSLGGGKSALLEQIREGAPLKKVDQGNKPPATSGGRDALLDQIRQGIQLKTVPDAVDSSPPPPVPSAGIVGALMEVMQKRSKAIHSSDDDDDDDDVEDFEEEDEWDD